LLIKKDPRVFHFFINSKNYIEAAGPGAVKLARTIEEIAPLLRQLKVKPYLAVPAFSVSELAKNFPNIPVLAQHLDATNAGSTTGYLVPEVAKISGARGSLLNHSEHRIQESDIRGAVHALRNLGMFSVVCARDAKEVGKLAVFGPDFIAIEPPELIGTGIAVSKARPELIKDSKLSLEKARGRNSSTILICGAGIVNKVDVARAMELGAQGILVASGVIKAQNWSRKIRSLARGFAEATLAAEKEERETNKRNYD
jgi:triosephosphate isomerase